MHGTRPPVFRFPLRREPGDLDADVRARPTRQRRCAWIVAAVALLVLLRLASPRLIPIVVAILISYVLEPLVSRLTVHHVPRLVGAGLLMLALASAGGAGSTHFATMWRVRPQRCRMPPPGAPMGCLEDRHRRATLRRNRLGYAGTTRGDPGGWLTSARVRSRGRDSERPQFSRHALATS
jgi:hypothetical protein